MKINKWHQLLLIASETVQTEKGWSCLTWSALGGSRFTFCGVRSCLQSIASPQKTPMEGAPENMSCVCINRMIVLVFNALSYSLCRQWDYHSETQRINRSLSSLACSLFLPPTRLWFGSHTWWPYNWLLLLSVLSFCLVGGCRGRMKETRKRETKEEEWNRLWIKRGHLLVYHSKGQASRPDLTWF